MQKLALFVLLPSIVSGTGIGGKGGGSERGKMQGGGVCFEAAGQTAETAPPAPRLPGPLPVTETLRVDDGLPTGFGANGNPLWQEAVMLPMPDRSGYLTAIGFYPHDPFGSRPPLYWKVWDDDGPGDTIPGTLLLSGVDSNLTYDAWNWLPVTPTFIGSGALFVGWSSENMSDTLDTLSVYWNWYDSNLDWYNYWDENGFWQRDGFFSGDFMVRAVLDSVTGAAETGKEFALRVSPSANPVQGPVTFTYALPAAGDVNLSVYDASGRLVKTLVSGSREAGEQTAVWEHAAPRGVYLYRLTTPEGSAGGKLIVQ